MKLINEKGKLFGIINIVDLLALVLVLLVVGAVAWKVFGGRIAAEVEQSRLESHRQEVLDSCIEVTYTVRIPQLTEDYCKSVQDFGLPQQLAINDGVIEGAFVTDVRSEPTIAVDANGDSLVGSGLVDLVFTVDALVLPGPFITVANQEVRVGKAYVLKTQFTEMTGVIETVECDSDPFITAGQDLVIYPGEAKK